MVPVMAISSAAGSLEIGGCLDSTDIIDYTDVTWLNVVVVVRTLRRKISESLDFTEFTFPQVPANQSTSVPTWCPTDLTILNSIHVYMSVMTD